MTVLRGRYTESPRRHNDKCLHQSGSSSEEDGDQQDASCSRGESEGEKCLQIKKYGVWSRAGIRKCEIFYEKQKYVQYSVFLKGKSDISDIFIREVFQDNAIYVMPSNKSDKRRSDIDYCYARSKKNRILLTCFLEICVKKSDINVQLQFAIVINYCNEEKTFRLNQQRKRFFLFTVHNPVIDLSGDHLILFLCT